MVNVNVEILPRRLFEPRVAAHSTVWGAGGVVEGSGPNDPKAAFPRCKGSNVVHVLNQSRYD